MDRAIYQLREQKQRLVEIIHHDPRRAIRFLNHSKTSFGLLYLLLPEIESFTLLNRLNYRNKTAADFCTRVMRGYSVFQQDSYQMEIGVMRWIVRSAVMYDGLDDGFDRLIDVAAAVLIRQFKDFTMLNTVTELIFRRNQKGSYNHDLIWALFSARRPQVLKLIAEYLLSGNPKDRRLACELLNIEFDSNKSGRSLYTEFISWLEQNLKYISVADFSQQMTSNPITYAVSMENKYLCKSVSSRAVLTDEGDKIRDFNNLDIDTKRMLSEFSNNLYRKNKRIWREWMGYPISRQIETARRGGYK